VVKIGVASGESSVERMFQVNRDYFMRNRESFKCKIKRDREVPADKVFAYETTLHKFFKSCQYIPKTKFDGSTELFLAPLEDIVQAYEAVIEGEVPTFSYSIEPGKDYDEDVLPF